MYKYYEYGTAAKGFASLVKDDIPIGKIDQYADALHDAALSYEAALKNWDECANREESNNGNA